MSNPDRLQREARDHAAALIEDRGHVNALAWADHCATRDTSGFWRRVRDEIMLLIRAANAAAERDEERDDAADKGDWQFHRDHDQ